MSQQRISLGKKGEALVASYLMKQGFMIKNLNYSCKYGEIDIIAQKDNLLTFVEVKLRRFVYFNISEVIVPSKQQKIIRTALHYRTYHDFKDMIFRFDVALLEPERNDYRITYMPHAFTASSEYFL